MKKTTKTARLILLILGLSIGSFSTTYSQFTDRQQTEIIIKTDSLITLYNAYGTFFEEVGYCSSIATANYAKLFDQDALLFDDLDTQNHQLKAGLFVEGYIEKARSIFPECLRKAEFVITERGKPVPGQNNTYQVILTGDKEIMAITDIKNFKLYRHTFKNYQVTVAFDKDLNNFRILNTGIKGQTIITPPKPVDISFIVKGPDGKPMPNVSVLLKLDGAEFQRKPTDENGEISFKKLPPETREVTIEAISLENSNMKYADVRKFQDLASKKNIIQLTEEKPIAFKIYIQDAKNGEKLKNALVRVSWAGQGTDLKTDAAGFCEIEMNSGTRNITILAQAEGYISLSRNVSRLSPNRHTEKLELKKKPLPQYFRVSLASGIMLTNKEAPQYGEFIGWQMNTNKPLMGFSLGYEIFPNSMRLSFLDIGLFGQLTLAKQQFDLKARSASSSVGDFADPDNGTATLNVSMNNLQEDYSFVNLVLSAGIVVHYQLIPEVVALHASLGPSLFLVPSVTHNFTDGNSAFYGTYGDDFFGTQFHQLPRYGYTNVTSNEMVSQKSLKSLGIGYTAQLGGLYILNDKFGLTLELIYTGLISNMLIENNNNYLAYIQYLDESGYPPKEYQYFGMLNSRDSFRWSNVGIQVGVRYTFKQP
jgi:hypothetical protein